MNMYTLEHGIKKINEIPRAGSLTLILCIPIYKLWFFLKKKVLSVRICTSIYIWYLFRIVGVFMRAVPICKKKFLR